MLRHENKYILAIDPGNKESAYVLLAPDLKPVHFLKDENEKMYKHMCEKIDETIADYYTSLDVAIEMIASYGMPVGAEVFETCLWIGKLMERFESHSIRPHLIYRKDEKMTLCQSMKANDATIKQALVDRFAKGEKNYGKGTKENPGFFYGFYADIWAAMAVGVTYSDMKLLKQLERG